jgi:hypothetical protein
MWELMGQKCRTFGQELAASRVLLLKLSRSTLAGGPEVVPTDIPVMNPKSLFTWLAVAAALNFPIAMAQQEIGYIENFALAADREQALQQLVPGTEDYYYFHALHYQNTGQAAKYAEILGQWKKRFEDSDRYRQIRRRQILIDYGKDPKQSLEALRRELGLEFNHQQEGKAQAQQFPTKLDPAEIAWARFLDDALRDRRNLDLLTEDAIFPLLAGGQPLGDEQRRSLLARATLPDLPGLVPLIAADLASKESRGFGEFPIHRELTIAQLDELRTLVPDLVNNENFIHTRLARLLPDADTNLAADPAAREAYLERAWQFVGNLAPSFNSLKAHLLYQRLVHDRGQGVYDAGRFMSYIKLPRNVPYIRPEWRRDETEVWKNAADPARDFRPITGLPPIGGDEPLVRDFLLVLLKDAGNFDAFAPYLSDNWLKAVFAETKIVNGIGDPERWASLLGPAAYQALKDRVDVDFDPAANPVRHGVGDPVKLKLHVKNVDKLIVKIFEINTLNYYLEHRAEISTDLQLDGLVPNHERDFEFKEAPARRVARDFEFPEIANRRGVWVVEFIGGGRSSRAVIRKGKIESFTSIGSSGTAVQVLDEAHQPVKNAGVWLGERRFGCDQDGRAVIPFTTQPGQQILVIEDDKGFASLAPADLAAENFQFHAGIHVPREALRPGALATIAIRPTLTVAGQPVSLDRLRDVRLVLTSTDLDGIPSTTTISDFKIESDREATHELRVPDRLASLDVRLLAKVILTSDNNREIELAAAETLPVNGQLRTERVDDLYLSRIDGGYVVEFLGRSGEARAEQNLNLTFHRRGFNNPRTVTLKADGGGGIDLGSLDGIASVTVQTPDGHQRAWQMPEARRSQPGVIHLVAGETARVPYFGVLDRSQVAIFSSGQGGRTTDIFDQLKLEGGFLVAAGLPAGDHRLFLKQSHQALTLRVAKGDTAAGHVFNDARTLQLDQRQPAHLAASGVAGDQLDLKIANADKLTRVHVVATRFLPDYDLFANLGQAPVRGRFAGQPSRLPNLFLSGRRIGDEFRYILERRYQSKLPGNMLERPEVLLNPWSIRDTESGSEQLAAGEDYNRQPPGAAAKGAADAAEKTGEAIATDEGSPRSIDFLANPPVELLNLRPDENGGIHLKLDAFDDRQHLHILVVDPQGASYQELSLPDRETVIRDLRLANALDPAKHFTEQDSVTLMKAGDTLVIPDLLTARFETFDDIGAAYRYLLALRDDPTLREFSFVTGWDKLKHEEKRRNYSKYACHELSFFLAMKDPEFFKSTVLPHLANKKDRTFLDDYLLDRNLDGYFAAFEYARLNVPERILLARRNPGRIDGIRLDLRDRLALLPPDLGRETFFFEGALSSFGLSGGRNAERDELGLQNALGEPEGRAAGLGGGIAGGRLGRSLGDADAAAAPMPMERKGERLKDRQELAKKLNEEVRYKLDATDAPADAFADSGPEKPELEVLYRALDATKEWAENNYYHLPIEAHRYELITENKFWLDFALSDGPEGFGSRHLGEASRTFHESMLALALLDLPFTAQEHKTAIEGTRLTFTAAGRSIAFHREIREAKVAGDRPPLLVSQSYFRNDDRFRMENGEKVDKFISDEFVAGIVYGSQVVVTNPTSSRQKLDVLIQIPKGSLPVLGNRATATRRLALEPYTTQRFEVQFYFPAAGEYPIFPAHVSKTAEVVAHADPFIFKVVGKPGKVDETSWAHISQWGSSAQVLDYLAKNNLHAIDLARIAWRCREDGGFMKDALAAIDLRGVYDATLFSYGILHNHAPAVRQYLLMQGEFLSTCGLYLDNDLIRIDPVVRRAYQHLEYKPLVNNRAHRVGDNRTLLNERIRGQYQQFMSVLSQKVVLDDGDKLGTAYHLFLQDRAEEAIARLDAVDPAKLPTRLQYDYFQAYAGFYKSDVAAARAIAARYAAYPVDRWREKFGAIAAQADEIEGKAPAVLDDENRDQLQARQAAKEPSLELKTEGAEVKIAFRNLAEVQVNYYEMDLEFLFSTNPFVANGGGGFSIVMPNKSERLTLPEGKNEYRVPLPREYQSKNVLIEVIGGGKKRSQAVFANELRTALSENFGILSVRHAKDDRPLPQVYVKVFAMTPGGPKFHKDGYTDLRGKFDYASVSTSDIADASKFSILVMSRENGATVLEAPVPRR